MPEIKTPKATPPDIIRTAGVELIVTDLDASRAFYEQRRSWWGHAIIPSWYTDASRVLTLDGELQPVSTHTGSLELKATVGADGFR
jgi:hypothetical protein